MSSRMLIFLAVSAFTSLLTSCLDTEPVTVQAFQPDAPSEAPRILRDRLRSNGSYLTGYTNGTIRSDRVLLEWQAPSAPDISGYLVFRDNQPVGSTGDGAVTSFTDSGLVPAGRYLYKVVAHNRQGLTSEDTVYVRTPRFEPPAGLQSRIAGPDGRTIELHWQNRAESATRYRVERKIGSQPDSLYQQVGVAADTFYLDSSGLIPGERFSYRLRAGNPWEFTGYSVPQEVLAEYILSPPLLTGAQQLAGRRSVQLNWLDNSNAESGFRIWRANGANPLLPLAVLPFNHNSFIDSDTLNHLQTDSSYSYAVSAFNALEETEPSNRISLTISDRLPFAGYQYGFEAETGPEWTFFSSTSSGRIVQSDLAANSGRYMLLMDVAISGILNANEAVLHVDLSSLDNNRDLFLNFAYNVFDDELSPLQDNVQISSDGDLWTTVYYFESTDRNWRDVSINLQQYTGAQPYSSCYQIKFRQEDDFSYPTDGIGIDDIVIDD